MILLVTDTHLDENPDNEYRWDFFKEIRKLMLQYDIKTVFHLGDMVDRKDRFSALFVNRLINELKEIGIRTPIYVLRGNHDTPLNGPAFFEFLDSFKGVRYFSKPDFIGDELALLPYTPNPIKDWKDLPLASMKAAFMHVTVTGAFTENGFRIEKGTNLPILPRPLKVYSGDVHVPQQQGNITYVGCPHPIKFGDSFPCRMLLLDDNYDIAKEIPLDPPRKSVIKVSSLEELENTVIPSGGRVRVEFSINNSDIQDYAKMEKSIELWAKEKGVSLAGCEFRVSEEKSGKRDLDLDLSPEVLLYQFASEEGVSEGLLEIGKSLLKEALG